MKKISRKLWYVLLMVVVISGMLLIIPGSLYACTPRISLTKTANSTSAIPGDTITYTFVVQNIGDVKLINVTLSDPMLDFGNGPGVVKNLGSLEINATLGTTATYVVRTADIGSLVNIATVTSTADVDVNSGTLPPTASATATATVAVTAPTPTEEVPPTPIYYMVTFDKNNLDVGSTEASPVSIAGIAYNATVTLPAQPTRTDYTFTGWNTAPAGSGTAFDAATAVTANIIVYAQWTTPTAGAAITVKAITEEPAEEVIEVAAKTEEVIEVAAKTEEVIEVAAITELPRTGNNMLFYVIGFALMAVGVAFGSFFIPKALRKREN